jgi:hypothetical protein
MTISVDLARSPKLYSNTFPAGGEVLGVVSRDEVEHGALVRIRATGLLVQVNAGEIRALPQRETERALIAALGDDAQARSLGGRLMGSRSSAVKAEAARRNGRLGGRPSARALRRTVAVVGGRCGNQVLAEYDQTEARHALVLSERIAEGLGPVGDVCCGERVEAPAALALSLSDAQAAIDGKGAMGRESAERWAADVVDERGR